MRQYGRSSSGASGSAYTGILMLNGGVPLDSTLRSVVDQAGTASPLQLSTTQVAVVANGAASIAPFLLSGTPYRGGTATTNFPLAYLNNGAVAPTDLNATATNGGTYFGVNAIASFAGNFLDFHVNGAASVFSISSIGTVRMGGTLIAQGNVSAVGWIQLGTGSQMRESSSGIFTLLDTGLTDFSKLHFGPTTKPALCQGAGTPEGAVTAPQGSIFMRSNGGILTSVYVKQSGTGNTGWAAIA